MLVSIIQAFRTAAFSVTDRHLSGYRVQTLKLSGNGGPSPPSDANFWPDSTQLPANRVFRCYISVIGFVFARCEWAGRMRRKRPIFRGIRRALDGCDDCSDFIEVEWKRGEQPGDGVGFVPKRNLRLDRNAFGDKATVPCISVFLRH